jgi:hypothetical protein
MRACDSLDASKCDILPSYTSTGTKLRGPLSDQEALHIYGRVSNAGIFEQGLLFADCLEVASDSNTGRSQ